MTDAQLIADTKAAYGWTADAFEIPADIKKDWEMIGSRGAAERAEWDARFATLSNNKQNEFNRAFALDAPKRLAAVVRAFKKQTSEEAPTHATRKSSELALNVINPVMQETVGGSADLSGSNNTKSKDMGVFDTDNRGGRYIHWGSANMVWPLR